MRSLTFHPNPAESLGFTRSGTSSPAPLGTRRLPFVLLLATILSLPVGAAGCGFGIGDDSGQPVPGQWWPWVCADGGGAVPDGGCLQDCGDGGVLNDAGVCVPSDDQQDGG